MSEERVQEKFFARQFQPRMRAEAMRPGLLFIQWDWRELIANKATIKEEK